MQPVQSAGKHVTGVKLRAGKHAPVPRAGKLHPVRTGEKCGKTRASQVTIGFCLLLIG